MRQDKPNARIVRLMLHNAAGVARLWRQCFPNEALRAWCGSGVRMTADILRQRTLLKAAFDPAGSFVALADARVVGFCLAARPTAEYPTEGHLCALAVEPRLRRQGIGSLLLQHAERYLRRCGARLVLTTFERNPLALLPGVPTNDAAYPFLLNRGYRSYDRDLLLVMVQQTQNFRFPVAIRERLHRLASEGIRISRMKPEDRPALERLLAEHFCSWHGGIASALDRGIPIIVAERQGRVLGFAGHFQVMKSGKGAFSALGVAPSDRRHGLGAALFNTMCAELKAGGASFVTLTTGLANPAQEIYLRAGFRTGCVVDYGMKKELGSITR